MSDRDVLQLLKMVRTAEHKLRPRGLFRAKAKGKQRDRKVAGSGAAAKTNGASAPTPPRQANGRPPVPPSTLPNSTVRPRPRPAPQAACPRASLRRRLCTCTDEVAQADFSMPPPPMPPDYGAPPAHAEQYLRHAARAAWVCATATAAVRGRAAA